MLRSSNAHTAARTHSSTHAQQHARMARGRDSGKLPVKICFTLARWEGWSAGRLLLTAVRAAFGMVNRCLCRYFLPLVTFLCEPAGLLLVACAYWWWACRSRYEDSEEAGICDVISHHQVGTSWLSPRHNLEIKDFHLRARHGGGRSENGLACRLRRRLWRRLAHKRYPND